MATIQPLTPPPPRSNEIAQGDKTPANIQYYGWFIKLQKVINALIAAGGGGGGISDITSTGGTITVTNPTGPTTNIEVANPGITDITSTDSSVEITNSTGPTTNLSVPAGLNFNVTPDTHPAIPSGVGLGPNDEFETGTSIDTAGTRYPGATAWAPLNVGTGSTAITNSVGSGSLVISSGSLQTGASTVKGYITPFSGAATFQAKVAVVQVLSGVVFGAGLLLYESSTTKCATINFLSFSSVPGVFVQTFSNPTTSVANLGSINLGATPTATYIIDGTNLNVGWMYFRVVVTNTTVAWSYSRTGVPGTYEQLASAALTSVFTVAPDHAGVSVNPDTFGGGTAANIVPAGVFDWFRRTA